MRVIVKLTSVSNKWILRAKTEKESVMDAVILMSRMVVNIGG